MAQCTRKQSQFQSTLSVRRATWLYNAMFRLCFTISIHALREESDLQKMDLSNIIQYFNPRSPWGERPRRIWCLWTRHDFNPRSPWGERHEDLKKCKPYYNVISIHALREESDAFIITALQSKFLFQSTLSVRRATGYNFYLTTDNTHFNPRSPWGERLSVAERHSIILDISIHALREESDLCLYLIL